MGRLVKPSVKIEAAEGQWRGGQATGAELAALAPPEGALLALGPEDPLEQARRKEVAEAIYERRAKRTAEMIKARNARYRGEGRG